jgi:hypothetical protein
MSKINHLRNYSHINNIFDLKNKKKRVFLDLNYRSLLFQITHKEKRQNSDFLTRHLKLLTKKLLHSFSLPLYLIYGISIHLIDSLSNT